MNKQRTGKLRFVRRGGQRILQEQWAEISWPNEPYREKGEEVITLSWQDIPTVENEQC